jgi:hypothetical protein
MGASRAASRRRPIPAVETAGALPPASPPTPAGPAGRASALRWGFHIRRRLSWGALRFHRYLRREYYDGFPRLRFLRREHYDMFRRRRRFLLRWRSERFRRRRFYRLGGRGGHRGGLRRVGPRSHTRLGSGPGLAGLCFSGIGNVQSALVIFELLDLTRCSGMADQGHPQKSNCQAIFQVHGHKVYFFRRGEPKVRPLYIFNCNSVKAMVY